MTRLWPGRRFGRPRFFLLGESRGGCAWWKASPSATMRRYRAVKAATKEGRGGGGGGGGGGGRGRPRAGVGGGGGGGGAPRAYTPGPLLLLDLDQRLQF